MKSVILLLLTAVTISAGCSSSGTLTGNMRQFSNEATLVTTDGKKYPIRRVVIKGDSIRADYYGANQLQIERSEVKEIRVMNHSKGARQGMLWGALAGGVVGYVWGLSNPISDDCNIGCGPDGGALFFGLLGVPVGAAAGRLIGVSDRYVLEPAPINLSTAE